MSDSGQGIQVLVTGASGFLGGVLASELAGHGLAVRALTRRTAPLEALAAKGVEVVRGDLLDPASLASAVAGRRVVFHAAGRVSDWGPREAFERANVTGTANLVAACRNAGVGRLVHVSSLTVLGLPRDGRTVDESTPPTVPARSDVYSATKLAGERVVREAHGSGGLATTVVRPGAIWGPGDPNVIPRIVAALERGVMPYVGGGANLLGLSHVRNLASALRLAGEREAAAGQLYHVTDDEEITARQALDELAAALHLRRPRLSLPFWLVYALAAAVERAARLSGRPRPPVVSRYGVRFVACHCRYDIGKARRELGYSPTVTFREGIRQLAGAPLAPPGSGWDARRRA